MNGRANEGGIDRFAGMVVWGVVIGLVVLLGRVVQLELAPSEALRQAMPDRVAFRKIEARRGELLDRRGRQLATSRVGERVIVDPERLIADPNEVIVSIAGASGADAGEIGASLMRALAENDRRRSLLPKSGARAPAGLLGAWESLREDRAVAADATGQRAAPRASETDDEGGGPRPLIRYVPVTDVLPEQAADRVRALGIAGVYLERRWVREYPGGDAVASLVGKVGFEHNGLLGAELSLEPKLGGDDGRSAYVRDAWGRALWIEASRGIVAHDGEAQQLSIDLQIQQIALEELQRGMEDADSAGGRILVADPRTGAILAMGDLYRQVDGLLEYPWEPADIAPSAPRSHVPTNLEGARYRVLKPDPGRAIHPAMGRNRCVEDIYEPGSTFKPFIWSLVTQAGLADPDEEVDTEGGIWLTPYGRRIADVTRRDVMTWREVLINSSNIGMVKKGALLGHDRTRAGILGFGFGTPTGVGLPGESSGIVTGKDGWSEYTQTSVSFGNEVAVTPMQMVRAFSAFARSGELAGTLPRLRLSAEVGDGLGVVHRVVSRDVAELVRETLAAVAAKAELRMRQLGEEPEDGWRWAMFGKSGTAEIPLGAAPDGMRRPRGARGYYNDQYNSSFIAGAPLEEPRLVVLVVIDDPGPDRVRAKSHYGSLVAGPVVRRVMERTLEYLGVDERSAPEPVASVR